MSSEFPAPDPNTDPSRTVPTPDEAAEALLAALIELEHYVGGRRVGTSRPGCSRWWRPTI